MQREEGVLSEVMKGGTEIRFHFFERDGGIVRRIPWHRDPVTQEWYSGIEGPEMPYDVLKRVVDRV
jgi:hypothetical protein